MFTLGGNDLDVGEGILKYSKYIMAVLVCIIFIWVAWLLKPATQVGFDVGKLKQDVTDLVYYRYAPPSLEEYSKVVIDWGLESRMDQMVHTQIFGDGIMPKRDVGMEFRHHFTSFGYGKNQSDGQHRVYTAFTLYNKQTNEAIRGDFEFLIDEVGVITHLGVRSNENLY
jgi:hypothetical protein